MTGGKSNRQRGDYFERQAKAALEADGWVVVRSAGSLGVADLVALRADKTPLLVSCKLSGRLRPAERFDLLEAGRLSGAKAVVAMRPTAGKVLLATVYHGSAHVVPYDEVLPVPPRKDPRTRREVPTMAVRDSLEPAGVQLTLPTT